MKDFVDGKAFTNEQGDRARKLFSAVVLAALDDAIEDDKNMAMAPSKSPAGRALVVAAKFCLAQGLTPMSVLSPA